MFDLKLRMSTGLAAASRNRIPFATSVFICPDNVFIRILIFKFSYLTHFEKDHFTAECLGEHHLLNSYSNCSSTPCDRSLRKCSSASG